MRRAGPAGAVAPGDRLTYHEFLAHKATIAPVDGFDVDWGEVNPLLKPFQRDAVCWAARGGRRALFQRYGLGKTIQQLEIVRLLLKRIGGRGLIVLPLGVRQEFTRDARMLATGEHPAITDEQREQLDAWLAQDDNNPVTPRFIRRLDEADDEGVYLTNYETIRYNKMDPTAFSVTSLDEAACLRGFGVTRTFREFMRYFEGSGKYRFVATAVPSPNDYIELLAYAAFLDILDVSHAKTKFFKRDSEHADALTILPHKEREFWLWCASWALFLQSPADLGYDEDGYALPPLAVRWHEIPSDHATAGAERDGQGKMFRNAAYGVGDAAREKRDSLPARIAKLMEIRAQDPAAHRLIWHDLEAERHAIEKAIPGVTTVYGNQDLDDREAAIIGFSDGAFSELAGKPSIAGVGCNFQRHCASAVFLGIGFKFHDFAQAIHRVHRFLQTREVRIDLIYTEAERSIRRTLEEKWRRHDEQSARMSALVREYGLAEVAIENALRRSVGVERCEASGERFRLINADSIEETARMENDIVDLILTSIPFGTQYEYTESVNDFGHTDTNEHFWQQMDYLTPELLRVLRPGRICAIHVKDRIVPSGLTGLGFQTVAPFHCDAVEHYRRHGFGYLGMKTIVTDVVRENNQTYRLGWTEQCKDGSRMGVGMPEYLLLFRKAPSDRSNGYADTPVVKDKKWWDAAAEAWTHGNGYSLGRWQLDADGFERSSGNRLLTSTDLRHLPHEQIYKLFRRYSLGEVYNYEEHVRLCEELTRYGRLPVSFMLMPPHSWHPDVWTDIARMRTLNMLQERKGREMHLCPMQFDIAERVIRQHSMPGETIFDPFSGLGTVPYIAVKMGRRGLGVELSARYHADALEYCRAAEREAAVPDLFSVVNGERC